MNAYTAKEATVFYVKIPSRYLETGIDILSDMLMNSNFDAEEIEKERKVILEEEKMYHDNPQSYTLRKCLELMYKSPFADSAVGNKETIKNIKKEDILKIIELYNPKDMIVSIVGDADFEKVKAIVKDKFKAKNKAKTIGKLIIKNFFCKNVFLG